MRRAGRSTPSRASCLFGWAISWASRLIIENVGGAGGMTGSIASPRRSRTATRSCWADRPCSRKPEPLQEAALRRRDRFRAGSAVRGFGAHPDHAQGSGPSPRWRSLSPTPRPTTPRCNTPRPARDRACTSAPCCSIWRWAPTSPTSLSRQRARAAGHDRGRIDFMCDQISTAVPQIQGGAVEGDRHARTSRPPVLAASPDRAGAGPGRSRLQRMGRAGPAKGTPEAVIRRLAKATSDAVDSAMVRDRFEASASRSRRRNGAARIPGQVHPARDRAVGRPIKASGVSVD